MAKTLVGALRVTLGLDSAEFSRGADAATARSAGLRKSLARIGLAGAAAGAALAGMTGAIRRALNQADDMGKAAQKFGLPVEQLSRLKYAADLSDVSLETLGTSLGQLSKKMIGAQKAGSSQAKMFERIGVSVTDAGGKLRDTEAVLQDVAGVFASMPDGAAKTALAMELFGKSGAAMIPLLNSGKTGLQAMAEEANKLGIVISGETAKSAEAFNDNLTKIGAAIGGIVTQMAAAMAPTFERISALVVSLSQGFSSLSPAMKEIIGTIAAVAAPVMAAAVAFSLMSAAISPVTLAIAAVAAGAALIYQNWDGISAWFAEKWEAVKAATAAAWEAIKTAIAAVHTWIMETWQGIAQFFTDIWTGVKDATATAWTFIKESIGGAIAYVSGLWDAFVEKLRGAVQTAKEVGQEIADAISLGGLLITKIPGREGRGGSGKNSVTDDRFTPASYDSGAALTDGIVTGASARMAERSPELAAVMLRGLQVMKDAAQIASPSKVTEGFGRNLAEGLAEGMTKAKDIVGQAAKSITDTAAGAMKGIGDLGAQIGDMFAGAATNVLTGVESLSEAVGKLLQQLASMLINSAMKQLFGNLFGGLGGGLSIPGFASGTFSASAGLAMVGEQGPELINLRGGERIYNARETARMGSGGAGGQPTQITQVYLDGEMILNQIDTPRGEAVIARVNRRLGR